jgi:hypothetical protein
MPPAGPPLLLPETVLLISFDRETTVDAASFAHGGVIGDQTIDEYRVLPYVDAAASTLALLSLMDDSIEQIGDGRYRQTAAEPARVSCH